jgi:aryl sulfotransferase
MNAPHVTRTYENHHLDSPRWDEFETRADDIVITTAYKSGTTWMQTIVANLIFHDSEIPGPIMDISPWVDLRIRSFEEVKDTLEAQAHRRFLKTHLALDGVPCKDDLSYIYVGRDLRDVFMSMWNHYSGHSATFYNAINNPETLVGQAFPHCPEDIKEFWNDWHGKSSFDWESDGYPYWSATHHAQTWWQHRHLPNILFIHYSDLLSQPADEIQRIADFLEIGLPKGGLDRIVDAVSFKTMKENASDIVGGAEVFWEGGAKHFLNKGSNGRWREVLDENDIAAYNAMINRTLDRDCAAWLEQGRVALT